MRKLVRPLAAAVVACVALSAHALTATIKREVPLLFPGVYLKNTPIPVAAGAESIAYDGLQVWVANRLAGTVQRFDAVNNTLKGTITLSGGPRKLVFDGTYVWVFTMNDGKAWKYSASGALQGGFPITIPGYYDGGAAFDGDFIWVPTTQNSQEYLTQINVTTRVVTNFPVPMGLHSVAFDGKDVWVSGGDGTSKVSGTSGQVLFSDPALAGPDGTNGLAFDGQYMWIASIMALDTVTKVDVTTNQVVATVTTYPGVHTLAFDGTLLWVLCTTSDTIAKIDTRTNLIVGTVQMPTGTMAYDIAFDGTHMWASGQNGLIYKFLAHY